MPHSYGHSCDIWDHTVLPATRQSWHSRLYQLSQVVVLATTYGCMSKLMCDIWPRDDVAAHTACCLIRNSEWQPRPVEATTLTFRAQRMKCTRMAYAYVILYGTCTNRAMTLVYRTQWRWACCSGIFSRALACLRGATQPVRMPCVCVSHVCHVKIFFSNKLLSPSWFDRSRGNLARWEVLGGSIP